MLTMRSPGAPNTFSVGGPKGSQWETGIPPPPPPSSKAALLLHPGVVGGHVRGDLAERENIQGSISLDVSGGHVGSRSGHFCPQPG